MKSLLLIVAGYDRPAAWGHGAAARGLHGRYHRGAGQEEG